MKLIRNSVASAYKSIMALNVDMSILIKNILLAPTIICVRTIALVISGFLSLFLRPKTNKIVSQMGVISHSVGFAPVGTTGRVKIDDFKKNDPNELHTMSFDMSSGWFLTTDIVNSTALYYSDPLNMKVEIDIHDAIAKELAHYFKGQIVNNEGDSWEMVFESIDQAVGFAASFHRRLKLVKLSFSVRIGIAYGRFLIRKDSSYKIYSELVNSVRNSMSPIKFNGVFANREEIQQADIELKNRIGGTNQDYKRFVFDLKSISFYPRIKFVL